MEIEVFVADYRDPQQGQELLDLLNHYARDPMGGGEAIKEENLARLLGDLALFPGAFSILARVDGRPAGFANCFMGYSTFKARPLVNIHDLAVHSDFRGHGLAGKLMDAIEAEARKRNCCKLTLEVLEGNTGAQKAYLKAGFQSYELDPATGRALFWEKSLG